MRPRTRGTDASSGGAASRCRVQRAPFNGWPGMKSMVMVESMRQTADQVTAETRYFVSSLPPDSKRLT
jgi:hypothetical protein